MQSKSEKIYEDPVVGKVTVVRKAGIRRVSVKVHPVKGVYVNVPWTVPVAFAMAFFRSKREWAADTLRRQKERYAGIADVTPQEIAFLREKARKELPVRLAELAQRYGFEYGKVTIRHNVSNWGSCSGRGDISLNLNLVRLPRVLCDYVLLHELCHLRHHDHGPAFHLLLEHVCTDNVLRLADGGDGEAASLAREAAMSKSRYPLDHVMTSAIRKYPII